MKNPAQTGPRPKAQLMVVFLLSICGPFVLEVKAQSFCSESGKTAPTNLFDRIKTSFTAEIDVVEVKERKSYRVHEHYSEAAEKSALYTKDNYQQSTVNRFLIYDKKLGESYGDWDGKGCKKTSGPTLGFHSLKLFQDKSASYEGPQAMKGEPMHLWRKCYKNTKGDDVSEEIYTTGKNSDWETPDGADYSPVMLVTKVRAAGSGDVTQVNQYVMRFKVRENDEDRLQKDLEPPVGTICGLKPEVALPKLPDSAVYSFESAYSTDSSTIIVDKDRKVIVEDGYSYYGKNHFRRVDSYRLNTMFGVPPIYDDGACSIKPYVVPGGDGLNSSSNFFDKTFSTLDKFLGFNDKSFTFNGEYTFRGIPCYAYTIHFDNYMGDGEATIVLYITADNVQMINDLGLKPVTKNAIVGREVRRYSVSKTNIFDFGPLDYGRFLNNPTDITACDGVMGSIDFGIQMSGPALKDGSHLNFDFRRKTMNDLKSSLAASAGIDELRIQIKEVVGAGTQITALGKMLGPVPLVRTKMKYGKLPDDLTVPAGDIVKSFDSSSATKCKKEALKDPTVKLATYCHYRKNRACIFYKGDYSDKLETNYSCRAYPKIVVVSPSLKNAWETLQGMVRAKTLKVNAYTVGNLVKMDPAVNSTTPRDVPNILLYEVKPSMRSTSSVKTIQYVDAAKCAEACTNSLAFNCERFTYCSKSKVCSLNADTDDTYYSSVSDASCDMYTRKYRSHFFSVVDTSAVADSEATYERVTDAEECARMCFLMGDFRCESFDFCTLEGGGSGTCSLSKKHFANVIKAGASSLTIDTKCSHFSRNYQDDYDRTEGITSLPVISTIKDSNAMACAHTCSVESESLEARCSMFQFCSEGQTCQIIDESAITSDALRRNPDTKAQAGCGTYSLKKSMYLNHKQWLLRRVQAEEFGSASDGGYGPGSMATLAMFMLVISFGLVFLALFVMSRYQKAGGFAWVKKRFQGESSFDNPSMKFSKDALGE